MQQKVASLKKEEEAYYNWVNSFIVSPNRYKKARIKEKARACSNIRNKLNAEIYNTSCGWDD